MYRQMKYYRILFHSYCFRGVAFKSVYLKVFYLQVEAPDRVNYCPLLGGGKSIDQDICEVHSFYTALQKIRNQKTLTCRLNCS